MRPRHQNCQVCRKGDNDEYLLLCDGCDRGCHMYCLRPKVTQVPEGDWFCPTCTAKVRLPSVAVATDEARGQSRTEMGLGLGLVLFVDVPRAAEIASNWANQCSWRAKRVICAGGLTCHLSVQEDGASPGAQRSAKKRTRLKKRRYEDDSSDEETAPRRLVGMATRHKDAPPSAPSSSSSSSLAPRYCGDSAGATAGISPAKRRRMTTRNQPDLTYCE